MPKRLGCKPVENEVILRQNGGTTNQPTIWSLSIVQKEIS